jgi:dUTP pyrophosphatase
VNVHVKVKRLKNTAKMPQYAHDDDACADLFACIEETVAIDVGQTKVIPTGLAMNPGEGFEILVRSRSGLSAKGVVVANSPGTVDPGYRGEVGVILRNDGNATFLVQDGAKIAQMAVKPIFKAAFEEAESLDVTTRGAGGFGSTGY